MIADSLTPQQLNDPRAIADDLEKHGLFDIARDVAARHYVTLAELLGRRRGRPQIRARRELWFRVYQLVPSYTWIGGLFRRDHCSIRAAILKHQGKPSRRHPANQCKAGPPRGFGSAGGCSLVPSVTSCCSASAPACTPS